MNKIRTRLASQRGATFSFALLVFLVCMVVSAIVIAAATASAGQFSELATMDQRYYSVTSAARVFEAALEDEDGAVRTVEQKVTGRLADARTETDSSTYTIQESSVKLNVPNAPTEGYDFLTAITYYAYAGTALPTPDGNAYVVGGATQTWEAPFVEPFTVTAWEGKEYVDCTGAFTITPFFTGGGAPSGRDYAVTVDARIWPDWTVELELHNADAKEESDKFSVYLLLAADTDTTADVTESLDDTLVDAANAVTNAKTVTKTQTTDITWHLEQVVPGRGLSNVSKS